jgi:hypothetical protein
MKVNTRALLERCIEEGLRDGYRRAHKHVDKPSEIGMKCAIEDAIWLHIDEFFEFDDEVSQPTFDEEENDRRFKKCMEVINNLKPGEIEALMGPKFMEEFRRVSQ